MKLRDLHAKVSKSVDYDLVRMLFVFPYFVVLIISFVLLLFCSLVPRTMPLRTFVKP